MKNMSLKIVAVMLLALPVCFSACVKDTCKREYTYTYYEPVYKTKDEVRANIKSNAPRPIENPGKLTILGNTIYLNEIDKGIHVIDNSNPSSPRNIAFIDIPGNIDIAVKGNILYADFFTDMVAIDISMPAQAKVKKFISNLFPFRIYGNGFAVTSTSTNVITDWIKRDTTVTVSCDDNGRMDFFPLASSGQFFFTATASGPTTSFSPIGIGGSMARFTIVNSRLYAVSDADLNVFNITKPDDPALSNKINVGWNIETIYPFGQKLFIGSQSGMFMYDIINPDAPIAAGQFNHVRSCDPVIADNEYAYVTLRSGTTCQGFTNELDIVKLNSPAGPTLKKVYPMTNPHGLSKDGNLLFICDAKSGLKIFNSADVMNLQLLKTINDIDAYDVIAYNKIALVVGKEGLYQYNYANTNNIRLLSKIPVTKQ